MIYVYLSVLLCTCIILYAYIVSCDVYLIRPRRVPELGVFWPTARVENYAAPTDIL